MREQKHLLLLGEAGHGKTIILKYVFSRLVECFLEEMPSDTGFLVPFYIPLREFSSLSGPPVDVIWSHISEDFPLPYEEFETLLKARQILLLLDGFDEIRGEVTQRLINERVASKVFHYAALLSCRKSFFDSYLTTTPLEELFHHIFELQPASINTNVIQYIRSVCKRQQTPAADRILNAIQMSKELQELAQRPLLLLMILEIFTSARDINEERWSTTRLYRKYTEYWLKHEAAKPDSVLKWSEKSALLQEMAWFTYRGSFSRRPSYQAAFTHEELYAFVRTVINRWPSISEPQLLDDLCFRSLLEISEEENYTFVHKSIQEYYVARYIFECMRSEVQHVVVNIERAFQMNHPVEIASFLKKEN
jgi:predicted NACHT family NTPase